jgi:hypothetical protein
MKHYFKFFFFTLFISISFSQWWYPEMEIIPATPTSNDNITIRIFGDTPSNVVSATTEWVIIDSVIILNTVVNLGPLTVIGSFETISEIGSLASGYYIPLAEVGYGAVDWNGNFEIFDQQTVFNEFLVSNVEECEDLAFIDFGDCDMPLGIAFVDGLCNYMSGCDWVVNGIDYSDQFFQSYEECYEACECTEGWVYCFVDPCLVTECPAYPDAYCIPDYCGGCFADFFVNGEEIDCELQNYGGCTDSVASNYDESATFNDGSCEYACGPTNPVGCFQTGCGEDEQCVDFGNSNVPGFCVPSSCGCDVFGGWYCTEDCNGGVCIPFEPEPGEICQFENGVPGVQSCNYLCSDISYAESLIGDGFCDEDVWGYEFNCPAFDCDGGDCGDELINGECVEVNLNCGSGDYNEDGHINILDIVGTVNIILNNISPNEYELCLLDVNEDGEINIIDIVQIVQWILNPIPQSIRIDTGTSFGECIGYCIFQLIIEDEVAHFVAYNWWDDLAYPDLVLDIELTNTEWDNIVNQIDFEYFQALDDVYGCPDCNDGGSEWIEISINNEIKKVTFEAYTEVNGIEELILLLRELRFDYWNQVSQF